MSSSRAAWVKEGWRRSRGDGGGYLWFSAKLWRWAAMWPDLWVLDWELFLSIAGGAAGVPSELLEALEAGTGFPPFAAESGSIANRSPGDELILLSRVWLVLR